MMDFSRKELIFNFLKKITNSSYRNSREWYFYWYKKILPEMDKDLSLNNSTSQLKIDVIFTCLPKDVDTISVGIKMLKNINHPINKIYLIGPQDQILVDFCSKNHVEFINEESLLGYGKDKIKYTYKGFDRSGWLFQQLLKWAIAEKCEMDHYLILDSDTFFIRNKIFELQGKQILDFSDEFHLPYYKTYKDLTGLEHKSPVSFVAHYMLIDKVKLAELKKLIEKNIKMSWHQAIISLIDNNQNSYFSEFETYANFVLTKYPKSFKIEYWFNSSLSKTTTKYEKAIKDKIEDRIKSLSFHTYHN